jgi:hypothetical protein
MQAWKGARKLGRSGVYARLRHPQYRARYAANLRRELPRIPALASVLLWVAFNEGRRIFKGNSLAKREAEGDDAADRNE